MKNNLNNIFNSAKKAVTKNSPEIMLGLGLAGVVSTVIFAVKATYESTKLIEEVENVSEEELNKKEIVQLCWKEYIPTAISGISSISLILGARYINAKRGAALATAYQISQTALSTYKDKVIETIGEKKEKEISDKVDKELPKRIEKDNQIIISSGKSLFKDGITGRYFESDLETIKHSINKLNRRMNYEMYVCLSDFYEDIGLPTTSQSNQLGWVLDDGLIELSPDTCITEDNKPAIVINFVTDPKYGYDKLA